MMMNESISFIDNDYNNISNINNNNNSQSAYERIQQQSYPYIVSILLIIAIPSSITNISIFTVSYLSTKNTRRNITLKLTWSLVLMDAYCSGIFAYSLIRNSLIQSLFKVDTGAMEAHIMETLRLGSIQSAVVHILALTCNHFAAITFPIKYQSASIHKKSILVTIILLWVLPPMIFLTMFLAHIQTTFLYTEATEANSYGYSDQFRLIQMILIVVPLLIISLLYLLIFLKLRHMAFKFKPHLTSGNRRPASCSLSCSDRQNRRQQSSDGDQEESTVILPASATGTSPSTSGSNDRNMKRRVRMTITALLIVGTFLISWIPGALRTYLTCKTCPFPSLWMWEEHPRWIVAISCVENLLIAIKWPINILIYAFRIQEIKTPVFSILTSFRNNKNNNNSKTTTTTSKNSGDRKFNNNRKFTEKDSCR